jgi:drug/metabolite transporter (DMT)-like permease
MGIKSAAYAYLFFALVLGALLPIALDYASSMGIYEFLFVTYAISVPASLVFVLARGKWRRLASYLGSWKDLGIIAAIGLLNYATLELGMAYAERFVTASLATVVYRTYPLLMLAFLPIVLRERVSRYQIAALSLGCIGLCIALSAGTLNIFAGSDPAIVALLVGVAFSGAFAAVLVKKYAYDMESSMFIFNLANFLLFAALFAYGGFQLRAITIGSMMPALYVGILYNVIIGFMYYGALRTLKTTIVTNIYFLSPFITILFAYVLLGEAIEPYYLAVAFLVGCGILIQSFDKTGGTYRARAQSRRRFAVFDVTGAFVDTGELAISAAIRSGGRVFAAKLEGKRGNAVDEVVRLGSYPNVFGPDDIAAHESDFVKDVIGAGDGDTVIIKAGDIESGERFFEDLSLKMEGP